MAFNVAAPITSTSLAQLVSTLGRTEVAVFDMLIDQALHRAIDVDVGGHCRKGFAANPALSAASPRIFLAMELICERSRSCKGMPLYRRRSNMRISTLQGF